MKSKRAGYGPWAWALVVLAIFAWRAIKKGPTSQLTESESSVLKQFLPGKVSKEKEAIAGAARALEHLMAGRRDQMFQEAEKAIGIAPDHPGVAAAYLCRGARHLDWANEETVIGVSKERTRQWYRVNARLDLDKALQLKPDASVAAQAHYFHSRLSLDFGNVATARSHAQEAARLSPGVDLFAKYNKAFPTFAYLRGVRREMMRLESMAAMPDPAQRVALLRSAADAIAMLPAVGVDEQAIRAGLSTKVLFDALADHAEYTQDPLRLVEAFVRGWQGDPFGTALEVAESEREINRQMRLWQHQIDEARALLSSKYGIEF